MKTDMYFVVFSTILVATAFAASLPEEARYGFDNYHEAQDLYDKPDFLDLEHHRERRQLGSVFVKSDHTSGADIKIPLTGNNKNVLSALGSVNFDANRHLSAASAGIALDNVNGRGGLSLTGTHIPNFGNQLTGAGYVNLLHNKNNDLTANAYLTRNMPNIPQVPNFNTFGGSLDYMYKNKIGASLGASRTPFLQKTDFSATGNLNLFRSPTTSLDFNAGMTKSISPFTSNSWKPIAGLTLRKFFL